MDMITAKGPSNRHEIWYLGGSELGAVRIDDLKYRFIDQPAGWLGEKTRPDVPYLINLRLDPFERTGWPSVGQGAPGPAQQLADDHARQTEHLGKSDHRLRDVRE